MKRIVLATSLITSVLLAPATALANPASWTLQLSTPFSATSGRSNTRTFNLVVSVSSANAAEIMMVDLYQNSSLIGHFSDNSSVNGDSWTQSVNLPSDGTYSFRAIASNSNGDPVKTVQNDVIVDTESPNVPTYLGKTRTDNSYEVKFTAPNDSDVAKIRIFTATTQAFAGSDTNEVGTVSVAPGQSVTFIYIAPDSSDRFFAIQAADKTGNQSTLTGDSVVSAGAATLTHSLASVNTTSVQSYTDSNNTSTSPQVASDQSGQKTTPTPKTTSAVSTIAPRNLKRTNWRNVSVTLVIFAALYAGYSWFMQKAE